MKKYLLLFLVLLAEATTAFAQQQQQRLVVWMKSGEKVFYELTEEPRTTFSGNKLVITTSSVSVDYSRSEVLNMVPVPSVHWLCFF